MFKVVKDGHPLPFGFVRAERSTWTVEDGRFKRLPARTRWLIGFPLWKRQARRYHINTDDFVSGMWRLVIRAGYEQGEGFFIRRGWMLER